MPPRRSAADDVLDDAQAIVEATACATITRLVRAPRAPAPRSSRRRAPQRGADRRRRAARAAAGDQRRSSARRSTTCSRTPVPRARRRRQAGGVTRARDRDRSHVAAPGRARRRAARRVARSSAAAASASSLGALFVLAGAGRLYLSQALMARKRIPGLSRALDAGLALLGRLRRDRLLDLLRARRRRAARARPHAVGAARRRRALPARRALVRRGHGGDPGDRRRRDVRPAGVQRPRRVRRRLGALPRLPDRDRARGAVRAALPRQRDRLGRDHAGARGTSSPASS